MVYFHWAPLNYFHWVSKRKLANSGPNVADASQPGLRRPWRSLDRHLASPDWTRRRPKLLAKPDVEETRVRYVEQPGV